MPDDTPTRIVSKLTALALVAAWVAITLALTFNAVAAEAPPYFIYFTALVFLLVGKLWDLEVSKILPSGGSGSSGDSGGGQEGE